MEIQKFEPSDGELEMTEEIKQEGEKLRISDACYPAQIQWILESTGNAPV